jgi:hypothetical protein
VVDTKAKCLHKVVAQEVDQKGVLVRLEAVVVGRVLAAKVLLSLTKHLEKHVTEVIWYLNGMVKATELVDSGKPMMITQWPWTKSVLSQELLK